MEDNDVAFIGFDKLHPCHRGFAESIGADIIEMDGFSRSMFGRFTNIIRYMEYGLALGKYDVVITEEYFSMRSAVISKFLFRNTLIRLIADETYIYMKDGRKKSLLLEVLSGFVDGGIAVSKLAKNSAEGFIKAPIKIAYPYVSDDFREKLDKENKETLGGLILCVAYNRPNKGIDRLVEAFEIAKEKNSNLKLVLVGSGHEKYSGVDGVEIPGYVSDEELAGYYKSADLYVQPSYGDTFPVAVLEALLAGTNVLVSDRVGQIEILPDRNIFSDQEELKNKLLELTRSQQSPRIDREEYYEGAAKKKFRQEFIDLVKKVK